MPHPSGMLDKTTIDQLNFKTARRYLLVVAFVVVLIVGGWVTVSTQRDVTPDDLVAESPQPAPTNAEISGPILPASAPVSLRIPALGISAPFEEPLGLQDNQEIEVPEAYDTVGYYQYGPTPGELGPAVVLGHVDSVDGPAVFYSLGQLQTGDEILIERADGSTAVFAVTHLERHPQAGFPTELVYGNIDHAGLRLITCSGNFDDGAQRYSHNLIVFAELVE